MLFHRNGNLQNSSSRMWSSYKIGLDVLNQRLNKLEDGSVKNEEINKLLSDPEDGVRSWKNLFKAKRLLVQHMEPEQIQAEIVSSLAQARLCGVPEVEDLAVELENSKEDPKAQRAYYDQLLDSLHYRHYQRMLQDETRTNTAFALKAYPLCPGPHAKGTRISRSWVPRSGQQYSRARRQTRRHWQEKLALCRFRTRRQGHGQCLHPDRDRQAQQCRSPSLAHMGSHPNRRS